MASCALYLSWGVWFGAVLLASIVMNYLVGKWIQRQACRTALSTGILLNLTAVEPIQIPAGIAITLPFSSLQKFAHLALPLGISFWTFQAMSYLFDLYRGEELDPTFVEFALYMAFFPVTISGPICRMPEMLPQFRSENALQWNDVERGLSRIAIGVLMMQLAKLLGQGILAGDGINSGFDRVAHWSGPDVWCLAFGYGLQLFFDFAGYSHIAIGAAKVLGFTVPENFARPFQSTTPSIFWTRWHMSLSFWIRDYVFLPLATMRREVWWRNLVLVLSMVVFGLWHNATLVVRDLGLLSRSAAGRASSGAAVGTQVRLGTVTRVVDAAIVDRDHQSHQSGMDLLPRRVLCRRLVRCSRRSYRQRPMAPTLSAEVCICWLWLWQSDT